MGDESIKPKIQFEEMLPGTIFDRGISIENMTILLDFLTQLPIFNSDNDVRKLLKESDKLKPWWTGCPEGDSVRARVSGVISYLHNKKNIGGKNALLMLLSEVTLKLNMDPNAPYDPSNQLTKLSANPPLK